MKLGEKYHETKLLLVMRLEETRERPIEIVPCGSEWLTGRKAFLSILHCRWAGLVKYSRKTRAMAKIIMKRGLEN